MTLPGYNRAGNAISSPYIHTIGEIAVESPYQGKSRHWLIRYRGQAEGGNLQKTGMDEPR